MKRKLLFVAVALLCSVGSWAQAWTSGSTVAVGDYYLYNVGADRFLNRGHNYYYRSLVDRAGSVLHLTADGENFFIGYDGISSKYFGADLYADKATNNQFYASWAFESVTVEGLTNAYRIKVVCKGSNTDNNNKYLIWCGNNTDSNTDWSTDAPTDNKGYWLLIPKDTREDYSSASTSNPFDMTYVVKNADFEQNSTQGKNDEANLNGWTAVGDCTAKYNAWNTNAGFGTFWEQWVSSDNNGKLSDRELKQTISSLPAGRYNVTMSALAAAQGKSDKSEVSGATVYANDSEQAVASGESAQTIAINNILVADGNLTIGYKLNDCDANWIALDNIRLTYNDPYISVISSSFENGMTMTGNTWYKFTVDTDGDYTFSATDGIIYTTDGNQLLSAATGTSASVTTALPEGTIYLKSTTSQALTITYETPVIANGDYYLYDATNKVFLSRGSNYGTRATVDKYGVPFTWNNYTKMIEFKDWAGVNLFFDNNNHTNCWLYTDGGSNRGDDRLFAFEATTGGYYLRDYAKAVYLKHDGSVLTVPTTNSSEATIWTLKTAAEHDAIVTEYANDNKTSVIASASLTSETDADDFEAWLVTNRAAKDKTTSIGTYNFDGNAIGDWTWNGTRTDKGAVNYADKVAEAYLQAGSWTQTITGLSNGIYKVSVNAFERACGNTECNTMGTAGWEPVTSYFEANGEKVVLKSWYSEKEGTNNPNTRSEAYTAFNNDKYKNEVYCYVSNGELTLTIAKPSFNEKYSWVLFNNVTLTYYDTDVAEEDATDILTEATTTMASPMKASLYQALSTAKSTFESSQTVPNYNALRTAIDNCATSITSYANMKANYLDKIAAVLASTNVYNTSNSAYTEYAGYRDAYDNYTDAETADVENATANALTVNTGTSYRYTSQYNRILATDWTINGTPATNNNSGFYINTWSTENAGTAPAADFENPFYECWVSSGSLSAATLSRAITGLLPNAAYSITANVRVQGSSKVAGSITMEVVGGVPVDVTAGSQIGETARYIGSYTATGVTDAEGNLVLKFNVSANSNISWLAFRDVNYATSDATVSNDFSALNSAITAAEAHSLGFESGDYAPYTNVAALETLAKAKAFDKTRYYIPAVIAAETSAVTSATWTANENNVDAVYNGMFTESQSGNRPLAWTRSSNWGQLQSGVEGDYATAFYNQPGSISYGNDGVYTMPLAANTIYKLTFAYRSHEDNSNNSLTASVLCGEDGLAATTYAGNSSTSEWKVVTKRFKTGVAGDYVLTLANDGNTWITNVSLVKEGAIDITFSENATAAPEADPLANVTLTRTLSADYWNTFSVPFNAAIPDGWTVKEFDSTDGYIIKFKNAESIVAGRPYLVKPASNVVNPTFDNVTVESTEGVTMGEGDYKFAAQIYNKELATNGTSTIAYLSTTTDAYGQVIKKLTSGGIKGLRAYFIVPTSGVSARILFMEEGETTGINSIDNGQLIMDNGAVYDLQGRKVQNPKRGMYIINGKKIIVK